MHDKQVLFPFLTFFLFPSFSLSWWGLTFGYRSELNLTGAVLSDHQILLILNETTFNYSHAPDADLRFVNSSNPSLPYWIESWNPAGESRVWLRVDSIPSLVHAYYGSPSASNRSDGPATFELFDDFPSGKSANWISNFGLPSGWQVRSGYMALVDSNPGPKEDLCYNQPVPDDIEIYSRLYMDTGTDSSKQANILFRYTDVYELDSVNTAIPCLNQSIPVSEGPNSLRLWVMDVFSNWASSPLVSFTAVFNDLISVVVDSDRFGYAEAEIGISQLEAPMRIMIGPTGRVMDQKRLHIFHQDR